jgi:hypothetical protein
MKEAETFHSAFYFQIEKNILSKQLKALLSTPHISVSAYVKLFPLFWYKKYRTYSFSKLDVAKLKGGGGGRGWGGEGQ